MKNAQDEAFIELYNETYDKLLKYVVLKCGNAGDVHDIIQNTYLNYYKRFNKNRNIEKPVDYIFSIAKNEINHYYRFKARQDNHIPVFSEMEDERDFDDLEFEMSLNQELPGYAQVDSNEIWRYLKSQDALTFKIFVLYFKFDEKLADIAKSLNISESNVKNRLYRTIDKVRKMYLS